jgi:acylphosphatase
MIHTRVIYTGRVQGVGFRWTCERLARGFAVAGFVQNQPDGSVLLECEGRREAVAGFLAAIKDEMDAYIVGRETSEREPGSGNGHPDHPGGFVIRRSD